MAFYQTSTARSFRVSDWLLGKCVGRDSGELRFLRQAERDRLGRDLHFVFACGWCFFVAWPVTYVEYAGIPLIACTFIRVMYTFGLSWSLVLQPLAMLCSLFWIWSAASLLWTPDVGQGVIQAGQARWLWCVFMIWPVIERRGWLIACLALGFVAGNCSQLGHAIGTHFDISWLRFDRQSDRNSGWWQPVVGGTILCGALGLHTPGVVLERGWRRFAALAGVCVSAVGIVATGSRGAWVAGLATLAVGLPVSAIAGAGRGTLGPNRRIWMWGLGAMAGVAVALAAAWPMLKAPVQRRYELARQEVAAALERGDYNSDTGARIWMARTAVEALRAHPVRGVGAGGFREFARERLRAEGIDPATRAVHAHAHDTPLQIGATLGAVGLVLGMLIAFVALWNGVAVASRDLSRPYAIGPGIAILGMLFAGAFDSIHVNTQTCAALFVLLGLCPSYLPRASEALSGGALAGGARA